MAAAAPRLGKSGRRGFRETEDGETGKRKEEGQAQKEES